MAWAARRGSGRSTYGWPRCTGCERVEKEKRPRLAAGASGQRCYRWRCSERIIGRNRPFVKGFRGKNGPTGSSEETCYHLRGRLQPLLRSERQWLETLLLAQRPAVDREYSASRQRSGGRQVFHGASHLAAGQTQATERLSGGVANRDRVPDVLREIPVPDRFLPELLSRRPRAERKDDRCEHRRRNDDGCLRGSFRYGHADFR